MNGTDNSPTPASPVCYPAYEDYKARIKSYLNWPNTSPVFASDLAESGLFYTGDRDRVKCYVCGGLLWKWGYGDNPTEEHKKIYPNCPRSIAESTPAPAPQSFSEYSEPVHTVFPAAADLHEREAFQAQPQGAFNCFHTASAPETKPVFAMQTFGMGSEYMSNPAVAMAEMPEERVHAPVQVSSHSIEEDLQGTAAQAIRTDFRNMYTEEDLRRAFERLRLEKGAADISARELLISLIE